MIPSKKYLITLLVLVILGIIFYQKVYIPKTTYETLSPTKGVLQVKVFGIGNVGAKDIYPINAQTGGRVLSILSDEGKWVKKGDLLARMDSVDLPELLEEAKVAVEKATLERKALDQELQSLMAQKNLALMTYKRYAKLQKQAFASKAEYDKAKADFDAIKAQIEATQARIKSADSEIKRAQKGVKALQVKLSRYAIYAPIDGYVISKDAEVHQTLLPSQSILKIVDPQTVWIKAYIDEKLSGQIAIGEKATITLRSQPNKKFRGVVKRIVAQSDAVTQEREVDVAFDKLPIPFYINEQAEVLIETKTYHDVVKIPAKVLTYHAQKAGVWIRKEDKAHFQPLSIIAQNDEELAVEGVSIKSEILLESPKNKSLKEGMKIH